MPRVTNAQIVDRLDQMERRMMTQFKYLIREIYRIEDGRPREQDRPVVVSQAPDPGTPARGTL